LEHASDEQLRAGLADLLANDYRTEARIIAHLAEIEARKLHLRDGGESLFDYSMLRLSWPEAMRIFELLIGAQLAIAGQMRAKRVRWHKSHHTPT
jgi:hypothetical protein